MNDRNDKQILAVLAIIGWALAMLNGFDLASSTVWSPTFAAYLQAFSALIAVRIAYSVPKKLQEREMRYREEEKARVAEQEDRRDFVAALSLINDLQIIQAEVTHLKGTVAVLKKQMDKRAAIDGDDMAYMSLSPLTALIKLSDFVQRPGIIPDEVLGKCSTLNTLIIGINRSISAKTLLLNPYDDKGGVFLKGFASLVRELDASLQDLTKEAYTRAQRNPRAWKNANHSEKDA